MPSLSEATARDWARMKCSANMMAYAIMDPLLHGPKARSELPSYLDECLPDLLTAGWVAKSDDDRFQLTEAGRKHLRSC